MPIATTRTMKTAQLRQMYAIKIMMVISRVIPELFRGSGFEEHFARIEDLISTQG
jgi:hypothetical protein